MLNVLRAKASILGVARWQPNHLSFSNRSLITGFKRCVKMAAPSIGVVEHWGDLVSISEAGANDTKHANVEVDVDKADGKAEATWNGSVEMKDDTMNEGDAEVLERALKEAKRLGSREDPTEKNPADISSPLVEMFMAISGSSVPVRSQQKGDPEFSQEQKMSILLDLYESKPLVFLERFSKVLREEHLGCFSHLSGDYTADYYCKEIRKASLKRVDRTRVRNKRYAALQQLITAGEYFSDEQMRERDPLMYEQYVGQYQSEEEIMSKNSRELSQATSLSVVLLNSCHEQVLQRRLEAQKELEENCEEEEDTDDDEESELQSDEEQEVNSEERALMREEFISRMHWRFLDGKDHNFDYSEVDENPDFDNLDIITHDEEEKYFDDDDDSDEMETEEKPNTNERGTIGVQE
ncbi:coiled-coil domain-containing protein 97 isoform X2 [Bombina bombina]|uniref:coiled-coil domain-containing protein 97 isoform X2 n=1 Tax=Bombina bombina TaxID=8345 RepID=UPI00235AB513|nr:coiled-coil domain-containing protein 97 isoform X2 [Bombina bombina]